jgi:hypothetical protein
MSARTTVVTAKMEPIVRTPMVAATATTLTNAKATMEKATARTTPTATTVTTTTRVIAVNSFRARTAMRMLMSVTSITAIALRVPLAKTTTVAATA